MYPQTLRALQRVKDPILCISIEYRIWAIERNTSFCSLEEKGDHPVIEERSIMRKPPGLGGFLFMFFLFME